VYWQRPAEIAVQFEPPAETRESERRRPSL